MSDKYFTVNIRAYLDKDEPTYIGEESLYDLLSDFSCPKNPDVEYFLLHNAIEFTKKDQSITYLVFDAEDASLVGYFSLTIKPISVRASNISKTMAKKLSRVSILDEETQSYTTAAYLIAQLGKNYSLPKENGFLGTLEYLLPCPFTQKNKPAAICRSLHRQQQVSPDASIYFTIRSIPSVIRIP